MGVFLAVGFLAFAASFFSAALAAIRFPAALAAIRFPAALAAIRFPAALAAIRFPAALAAIRFTDGLGGRTNRWAVASTAGAVRGTGSIGTATRLVRW